MKQLISYISTAIKVCLVMGIVGIIFTAYYIESPALSNYFYGLTCSGLTSAAVTFLIKHRATKIAKEEINNGN